MQAHRPATAQLTLTRQFTIAGTEYLLGRPIAVDASAPILPPEVTGPVVVVHSQTFLSGSQLDDTLRKWAALDDVFNTFFASTVIVVGRSGPRALLENATGTGPRIVLLQLYSGQEWPQEGPYYASEGLLFNIWRLYPDTYDAFFLALKPQNHAQSYSETLRCTDDRERRLIAVPSRIPTLRSGSRPLEGCRLTIKDNIDLKGVRTGLSSKAWLEMYDPVHTTSAVVAEAVESGAVVVGKTKLSQFALPEIPTAEWVDVHCPINPRADDYLSPGGSSTGGAVAAAAYDWIDACIGTDTAGSIRIPAARAGVFAIRPTTGSISTDGILLPNPLNTPGFLARDISTIHKLVEQLVSSHGSLTNKFPDKVFAFVDHQLKNRQANVIFHNFLGDVELYTGLKTAHVDLNKMFAQDNALGTRETIVQSLGRSRTIHRLKSYSPVRSILQFKEAYLDKYNRDPNLNPLARWFLQEGKSISPEEYNEAIEHQQIFKDWFGAKMKGSSASGFNVAVIPLSADEAEYRDSITDLPGPDDHGTGWSKSFISPLAGCPELVLPIGQVPYHSRASNREEYFPVVVGMLGPPGSDAQLTRFAMELLEKTGRPTRVKTGRFCFDLAAPDVEGRQDELISLVLDNGGEDLLATPPSYEELPPDLNRQHAV